MTIDALPDLNAYPTPERAFRYLRLIARWPRFVGAMKATCRTSSPRSITVTT